MVRFGFVVAAISLMVAEPTMAQKDMVVSQEALASRVGAQILARGGNAVDASVATAFALAVTHPAAGNIGGGGFMVVRLADGTATTFDFRETAPLATTPRMFFGPDGKYSRKRHHLSHLAVGVPGTVAGLWLAHRRLGRLPWRELVAPAVALARDGIEVTASLAGSLRRIKKHLSISDASLRQFFKPDGTPYVAGELLRQPELAESLARILTHGADGFYRGRTADLIVAEMKRGGGIITHEDLAGYTAVERAPVRGQYRGHEIISMPPPSSGGITLINMLNMLETHPIQRDPTKRIHLLAEIMRRGFAERARHLGDPGFNDDKLMRAISRKEHGVTLAASIDLDQASKSRIEGIAWDVPEGDQTTHLSVVDRELNAVSLTYTLEFSYGSGITVQGGGFLLNNEMGDFNPAAGMTTERGHIGTPPNLLAPKKRMLSSMTPTIVAKDGIPRFLVGSPGGRTIINTVFQIVANVIDLRMDIRKAVAMGRIHHQWFPDQITIEKQLSTEEILGDLRAFGHEVRVTGRIGAAECIEVRRRRGRTEIIGAPDPRAASSGAAGNKQ